MDALKVINARVKVLQKKNPNKKRKTLQKQAGKEYRDGRLKKRKKVSGVKKKAPKRKAPKRKTTAKRTRKPRRVVAVVAVARVKPRKRVKSRRVVARPMRRRVSGSGSSMKNLTPWLIGAGVLAIGYMLLRKPAASSTVYIPTGNAAKDTAAQQVLSWASTAGVAAGAFANIIKALNAGSASQVQNLAAATQGNPAGFGDSSDLNAILSEMGG